MKNARALHLVFRRQPSQTQIVHHILHFLDPILDAITALPERVVLQVQDLEARVDVLDELADLQRPAIVSQRDRVARKASLKKCINSRRKSIINCS